MRILLIWAQSIAVLLTLSGTAYADTAVSQTNDPTASVDTRLSMLLGQERTAFSAVAATRLQAITKPVARPGSTPDAAAKEVQYSDAWLDTLPVATGDQQWSCLTRAIYFEARGESVKGEFAVAEVVANRVDAPEFPKSMCDVVNQGTGHRNACQFSFTCDGMADVVVDRQSYEKAGKIARLILDGAPRVLTDGATYFHTVNVRPDWSYRFEETAAIGAHVFYRAPILLASN
ncbi:MAG: cell wall hydrolase [Paracoccaceae bacterium]|nr:cell wall hydrolase [Paracoccaceae bacterium]